MNPRIPSCCCLLTCGSLQEQAFEEREKYKEGKFIVEKAKVMKVGAPEDMRFVPQKWIVFVCGVGVGWKGGGGGL
jgi:hypothetical protein